MREDGSTLVEIDDLHLDFHMRAGIVHALNGVDLVIERGRTLGLVGESGCGKSITARSILRLVPKTARITEGSIRYQDAGAGANAPVRIDTLSQDGPDIRGIRGKSISMIFQEPQTSLSPVHSIGRQITEALRLHLKLGPADARQRAIDMLGMVGFRKPETIVDRYSFELSGGMRQRAMIAMALCCRPSLLIADEPTTALDVTIQAQILALLGRLQQEHRMSILLITHNLGVVAGVAHRVAVMYMGRIVEHGETRQVFKDPRHPYTQGLLKSIPQVGQRSVRRLWYIKGTVPDSYMSMTGCAFHPRCPHAMDGLCDVDQPGSRIVAGGHSVSCHLYPDSEGINRHSGMRQSLEVPEPEVPSGEVDVRKQGSSPVLLSVSDLTKHYTVREGIIRKRRGVIRAVDGISFDIRHKETLALVGESGCGKTTTGKCILRAVTPTRGAILLSRGPETVNLTLLDAREMRGMRKTMQMIFQDPYASLNPRMTVQEIIGEPLLCLGNVTRQERARRVTEMMEVVGLNPKYMSRYPHAFSGGQRQRIGIARALVLNPDLVVADEPVSALDVSIQAQVINLMEDLQDRFELTYLFISHDLGVVQHIATRVAVMYLGKLVEIAATGELFGNPLHPYTEALLSAVPRADPDYALTRMVVEGEAFDEVPSGPGCPFHPRCTFAKKQCHEEDPVFKVVGSAGGSEHRVACHLYAH